MPGNSGNPQPGDLIFLWFDDEGVTQHIGIVEAIEGKDTFITIEGNTSPGSGGSQDNGGGVFRRTRYRKNVTYFIHAHDFVTNAAEVSGVEVANNEEGIWRYLKKRGLSDHAAAGVMGNMYAESGLRSNNLQNDYEKSLGYTDDSYTKAVDTGAYKNFTSDSAGYGLAQWTASSRKQKLFDFIKTRGASIGDHNAQLDYFWQEIQTGKKPVVKTLLDQSTTVDQASDKMLYDFEAPNNAKGKEKERRSYSKTYYDRYHGKGGPKNEKDWPLGGPGSDIPEISDAELDLPNPKDPIGGPDFSKNPFLNGTTSDLGLDPLMDKLNPEKPITFEEGSGPVKPTSDMYGDIAIASIKKPDQLDLDDAYVKKARQMSLTKKAGKAKQADLMQQYQDDSKVPMGGPISDIPRSNPVPSPFTLKEELPVVHANAPNQQQIPQVDLNGVLNALATITTYLGQIATNTSGTTDQLGLLAENGFVDKGVRDQFENISKKLQQQKGKLNQNTASRSSNSRVVSNLARP